MIKFDAKKAREIVRLALKEDIGTGDITTNSLVPASLKVKGDIITCEQCIIAGLPVAKIIFEQLSKKVKLKMVAKEGSHVSTGKIIAEISGPARAILTGERTALNFLQHLSGIATFTAQFVEKAKGCKVKIKDTRKTTPCLRYLEKYAVRIGGGENHRMGLYDMVMIKDNHLNLMRDASLTEAVKRLRKLHPNTKVEIEAETIAQVQGALSAGADVIMLDNMNTATMKRAIKAIGGKAKIEASGGMTLKRIKEVARSGVDWISVGAITASAPSIDIKLELK